MWEQNEKMNVKELAHSKRSMNIIMIINIINK